MPSSRTGTGRTDPAVFLPGGELFVVKRQNPPTKALVRIASRGKDDQ
jgi:hypothetical protein